MEQSQIVILGAAGSGRTTIGQQLATTLSLDFLELEDQIAEEVGVDFSDLVLTLSAVDFQRLIEETALRTLSSAARNVVVTLPPSASKSAQVLQALDDISHKGGAVVLLDAPVATLAHRNGLDAPRSVALGRPRAQFLKHLAALRDAYLQVRPFVVDTSEERTETAVTQIIEHFALQ